MRAPERRDPHPPCPQPGGAPARIQNPSRDAPQPYRGAPRSPMGGSSGQWRAPDAGVPSTFQCFRCGEYGHRYRECTNEPCAWPPGKGKGKGKGKGNVSPRGKGTNGGRGQSAPPPSTRAIAPPPQGSTTAGGRRYPHPQVRSSRGAQGALGGRDPLWLAIPPL